MKVIFLDVDGVLNSNNFFENRYKQGYRNYVAVDPEICKLFVDFIKTNDIKLIISSTWRLDNVEHTQEDFELYEGLKLLNPYIVGVTPRSYEGFRGKEIKYFLEHTELDIESYVIIDDDSDMLEEQNANFMHIDNLVGLQQTDFNKILNILKLKQGS